AQAPTFASVDDALQQILDMISTCGYTLRTFLLAVFDSKGTAIRKRARLFYSKGGPGAMVDCWSQGLRHSSNDESFMTAVTNTVIDRAHTELNALTALQSLRQPTTEISSESIESFSLEHIEKQLQRTSPNIVRVLQGFALANHKTSDLENTSFVATIGSLLLHHRSQKSNYFQMMIGLFLYSTGCPKRVVTVLSQAGLSVSYQTICNALRALTKAALAKVQSMVLEQPWFLVYDNINIPNRKYDQRGNNIDTFENGTTATVVIGEDLGHPQAPAQVPRDPVTLMDLLPDNENRAHFRTVSQYNLVHVLQRHFDIYNRHCSIRIPALSPLPVKRTETFPMPSMKIDQSTVEGNLEIIETVMKSALKLSDEWFDGDVRVVVAGDQLTVCRVGSLKSLRGTDITSTILRTHYGSVSTPGSLAFNIAMLERKRVNLDTPDFHAADEILRNTFDAMVQRLWEIELGTEDLGSFGKDTPRLDDFISEMSGTIRR
ncbi:hypothetical protein BGZ54_004746, partial [Gamsiella multidivaricata]